MTKLEQKLIELGYKLNLMWCYYGRSCYEKECNFHTLQIYLNKITGKISISRVISNTYYEVQLGIDYLQQAFNQLEQDLEVLKEYEI